MTTPALLQLHECSHMGAFSFMENILVKAAGGALVALLLFYRSNGGKQNYRNEKMCSSNIMDSLWNLLFYTDIRGKAGGL